MEKEHYILKYTHPYLLSNRTCSKYFVISNAAIDSLLLGLSDLSQLSCRQMLLDSRTGMFGNQENGIFNEPLEKICTLCHPDSQSLLSQKILPDQQNNFTDWLWYSFTL